MKWIVTFALAAPVVILIVLIGLFVIGSRVARQGTPPHPAPPTDAPIRNVPPPTVRPDPNGLQSPDWNIRQIVASRLGETARVADCDALLAALASESRWEVRAAIVTGIGKQWTQCTAVREKGSDRLLGSILPELDALEVGRRAAALRTLTWIGDRRTARSVLPLLHDSEDAVRKQALNLVAALRCTEAVPELIRTLQTPSDSAFQQRWARIDAANALGRIGDTRAVEPLVATLTDPDAIYRASVITALARLNAPQAATPLRERLQNDTEPNVRFAAICAVAHLRDRGAIPLLEQIARTDQTYVAGDHMNEVAERAIRFIKTGRGKVSRYE